MLAFHNDEKIKAEYIARVKAHAAADEIVKGQYWEKGKGCAIGCTIHSENHASYENNLGIPKILARLEDNIFENLPNDLAMTWPLRFLEAIPVGADLELVWPKFIHWLLMDPEYGVIRFNQDHTIIHIGLLYEEWIIYNIPINIANDALGIYAAAAVNAEDAYAAANAAYAANTAAYAAAYAAAAAANAMASSANTAAYTVTNAAAAAAYAASNAEDARSQHYVIMSDKILSLLREAK